ncbi:hypothetical protein EMIT093MI4_30232 [Pseudomonas sp. IT-93MI4]
MTRSFSYYTDGAAVYLTTNLKIFFESSVGSSDAFASKPAPTFWNAFPCGSGLAREEASSPSAK